MNFTKMVSSKLNVVADWIIRLVMINLMIIFFSLAVITIYPAVSAGYNLFNDYVNNKNPKLFKDYFKYFKEKIGKKLILSLIVAVIAAIAVVNIQYYMWSMDNTEGIINTIGYYITLALIAMVYVTVLYTFTVMKVKPDITLIGLFKTAFFLAGRYYFVSMLLVVTNSVPFILLMYPQTIVFFIFMGASIPVCLNAVFTKGAYIYLKTVGEQNG